MNLLHLSWKNLTFKPLSLLLSVVLFALGIGLISLLFQVQDQLQKNFEKNLAGIDLVIGAKGSPLQLILSSMYHIDNPTGNVSLGEVRPFLNPQHPLIETAVPLSLGDSYRTYRIVGTTSNILDFYGAEIAEGKAWDSDFEVTIGTTIAEKLGLKIGSTFHSSHGFMEDDNLAHDHTDFRVVGILARSGTVLDQLILTTNATYWLTHQPVQPDTDTKEKTTEEHGHNEHKHEHHDHEHEHEGHDHAEHDHSHAAPAATTISIAEAPDDAEITSLMIKFKGRNFQALNMQRSINENTDMQAATPAIEINRLYSLMDTGEQALRMLAIVIIFVSGLSIFISLFASLKERRYELALMRVMGGTRQKLFLLILLEGLLMALIGCVVGLLISHGGMALFGNALERAYGYSFSAGTLLRQEWYLVLGGLGLGIIAALIPAIKAGEVDIAETLLGE